MAAGLLLKKNFQESLAEAERLSKKVTRLEPDYRGSQGTGLSKLRNQ